MDEHEAGWWAAQHDLQTKQLEELRRISRTVQTIALVLGLWTAVGAMLILASR